MLFLNLSLLKREVGINSYSKMNFCVSLVDVNTNKIKTLKNMQVLTNLVITETLIPQKPLHLHAGQQINNYYPKLTSLFNIRFP